MTAPALKRKAKSPPRGAAGRPVTSPPQDLLSSLGQRPWILAAILAIATFAVYLPVHHHPFFTMDDDPYVVNNPHIRSGFSSDAIGWAFTSYDLANWHPVTWFSHILDYQMFQLNPPGHHDVNLLLHMANVLLLFWVLLKATGYAGRSFMVAGLFALHPINVETVAWVAERKNLLSMLFFLLALGAYQAYVKRPSLGRYVVVALLFALGLMAKPQVITFPFVLLLWDYWPLQRMFAAKVSSSGIAPQKFSSLLVEKIPLFVLAAGSAVMTLKAQRAAGALRYYPFSARLGNAIVAYVRYIAKALWPSRLAVFYPHTPLARWQVLACAAFLLGVTALVVRYSLFAFRQTSGSAKSEQRTANGAIFTGWFWFLGTLVPMIGLVQVGEQAMADRYAYLSFVGLFLLICWGVADWAQQRHVSRAWVTVPGAAVIIVLAVLCYRQVSFWEDNVTLWTRMLAITPGSYEVEENLGVALLESGQDQEAMQHFQEVTVVDPSAHGTIGREQAGYAAVANLYLGAYDQQHGQLQEAIGRYQNVLSLANSFATQNVYSEVPPVLLRMKAAALANMGDANYELRNFEDAKSNYKESLTIDPRSLRAWTGVGVAEQRLGDVGGAIDAYTHAVKLQPSDVGYLLLAQALQQNGRTTEAEAAAQQAKFISRDLATARHNVDVLLTH